MSLPSDLIDTFELIKEEIKDEYRKPHNKDWIVGFSGGKDSTLMLHLVVEGLLEIPFSQRNRRVHVVANDTLVESPIMSHYVEQILKRLQGSLAQLQLPFIVQKTYPAPDCTFWVNLIGRGYPAPTRMFRWCTDRMKIKPTTNYIREQVSEKGEVLLLLGVRRTESSARAKTAKRYDNGERLNRHNDITGCWVFRPILEVFTEEVWEYLMHSDPPWGGNHRDLFMLYKNATGGDCPVVLDPDTAPSCGSSSIRFGCWTCTVVEKDKSFRNSMEQGFEYLEPMADFRDWLREYCYCPDNRMPWRRNGQIGLGPLTFESRKHVLKCLMDLQDKVGERLISASEVQHIERIWKEDKSQTAIHKADRLLKLMGDI